MEGTLERPAIVDVRLRLRVGEREWLVDRARPTFRIGRADDNDLVVNDPHTSRYHASITYRDGRFSLVDDSRNGTLVQSGGGATCFVRRETFPLDGQGSVRLGSHDGQEVAFTVEVRSADGHPWRASVPGAEGGMDESANVFRQEGEWWTVMHQGAVVRVKDTRGMRYLAHLLRHPGQEFHVLDLASAATGADEGSRRRAADAADSTGPLLDVRAKTDYRRRLSDLRGELEEAERWSDVGRADRLRAEIDLVASQLVGAVGLHGRDREAVSNAERARVAVTRRIRGAVGKIARAHTALGYHLDASVHTGRFCSYRPDPSHPIAWTA
jgi:hypothetical protein